jgi:hypothetical protein
MSKPLANVPKRVVTIFAIAKAACNDIDLMPVGKYSKNKLHNI